MAIVFILGPGMWDPEKRTPSDPAPRQVRRDIAKNLKGHGHDVVLMEDDVDREGEDLIDKFDRLLRQGVTEHPPKDHDRRPWAIFFVTQRPTFSEAC